MADDELMHYAKEIGAPYELVKETKDLGRMPVVNFCRRWGGHSRGWPP